MVVPFPVGHSDPAASLPPELLLKLVRGFTFDEVRPLLAVSSRWRAIALNSEPYWTFIHLQRFTAGGANLFLARLARSGSRPVSLTIDLRLPNADLVHLQDAILTAVHEHLDHLNWLLIYLSADDATKLWPALIVPAPLLRYFDIRVDPVPGTEGLPMLPENLFSGHAPLLRDVEFEDFALPPTPLSIFAQVTKLCIQYGVMRPMEDIFSAFPRLVEATLTGWATYEHPVFSRATSYRNIKQWTWRSGRGVHNVPFPLQALRGIPNVTLYNPLAGEILGLIGQLPSPLAVGYIPDLQTPEDEFQLTISASVGAIRHSRAFIDEYRFWSESPELDFRLAMRSALAGNVDTVYLNANSWSSFVKCIPPIPSVRWVHIFSDEPDEFETLTPAVFPSPALEKLEFDSQAGCVAVAQERIFEFAQRSFDAAALRRSILALTNVHITGELGLFSGVVKQIYLAHDRPCTIEPRDDDWYTLNAH